MAAVTVAALSVLLDWTLSLPEAPPVEAANSNEQHEEFVSRNVTEDTQYFSAEREAPTAAPHTRVFVDENGQTTRLLRSDEGGRRVFDERHVDGLTRTVELTYDDRGKLITKTEMLDGETTNHQAFK